MPSTPPVLVSVDWGTTALRCALVGQDGGIIERRDGGPGIMQIQAAEFSAVLESETGDWRRTYGPLPVLMSGMVGSRQGWVEAPYLSCPATVRQLADALLAVTTPLFGHVYLVPGLAIDDGKAPDVMRGEETQIFGACEATGRWGDELFVLPGTHSKWVTTRAGAITSFATYMTGEVFSAVRNHSILGRLMASDGNGRDASAFERGIGDGAGPGHPGDLLHRLFATRTLGLFDKVAANGLEDYLSGLLVGAELGAATAGGPLGQHGSFVAIGSANLCDRYLHAARVLGLEATAAPSDCAAQGHLTLAKAAGLLKDIQS